MMKLTGIDKSRGSDECWSYGETLYVNAAEVAAVVPMEHRYHSFRSPQKYSEIHLKSGAIVEVMNGAEGVAESVAEALKSLP